MTQQEYFDYKVDERGRPVLSSSFLKVGIPMRSGNPERLESVYNENIVKERKSKALGFGTLVHQYAEDKDRFVMMPEFEMSDKIREIADKTFKLVEDARTDIWDNVSHHMVEFNLVADEVGWGKSWKPETRLSKFRESADDYWDLMKSAQGKIVVTGDTVQLLNNVIKGIEAAGLTYPVLKDRNEHVRREEAILFEIDGKYPAKALLDIIEFDHDKKEITITDIKTTAYKIESFIQGYSYREDVDGIVITVPTIGDFIKYGYFFQGFFYVKAMLHAIGAFAIGSPLSEFAAVGGYKIIFQFAVVETTAPYLAKMITMPDYWMDAARTEYKGAMLNVEKWFDKLKYLEF